MNFTAFEDSVGALNELAGKNLRFLQMEFRGNAIAKDRFLRVLEDAPSLQTTNVRWAQSLFGIHELYSEFGGQMPSKLFIGYPIGFRWQKFD